MPSARSRPSARAKGAKPVHSLHDAALTMLDDAIEALKTGDDDETVHAARKACKRVRAALRLLREAVGPEVYQRENNRVRDAARPLTAVRDAFMLRRTLRSLPKRPAALQRALDSEYRRERKTLQQRGARTALDRLKATREGLIDLPDTASEGSSAIAGARAAYKAGRKALREARHRDDLTLHEWRKQSNYLLNQLDLLKAVFNANFNKIRRHAEQLAELLGDDHDLAALISRMRRYEVREPLLLRQIEKQRGNLQARAFRLGKRLYRHSAKQFEAVVAARLPPVDSA